MPAARDQAIKEIAAVEAALNNGHTPANAIHAAAMKLGIGYQELARNIGAPGYPGDHWHRFCLGVEWKRGGYA